MVCACAASWGGDLVLNYGLYKRQAKFPGPPILKTGNQLKDTPGGCGNPSATSFSGPGGHFSARGAKFRGHLATVTMTTQLAPTHLENSSPLHPRKHCAVYKPSVLLHPNMQRGSEAVRW